jgi:hypothetical protein
MQPSLLQMDAQSNEASRLVGTSRSADLPKLLNRSLALGFGMQPRDPDHPSESLLHLPLLGFGMVQTEPNFQDHVHSETGSRFRSSRLCRLPTKQAGSTVRGIPHLPKQIVTTKCYL